MCRPVVCRTCKGTTWAGCGMHVADVMRGVPQSQRCSCEGGSGSGGGLLGLFRRKG